MSDPNETEKKREDEPSREWFGVLLPEMETDRDFDFSNDIIFF